MEVNGVHTLAGITSHGLSQIMHTKVDLITYICIQQMYHHILESGIHPKGPA